MNFVKKLLLVHGDPRIRRQLVLLSAGAGFDVRSYATAAEAAAAARDEWFELALVDLELPDAPGFAFVETLRKIQPTVPVLVLVTKIELPLVIKSIRLGVADVLLQSEDLRPVMRCVRSLLGLGAAGNDVTPEELAQADAILHSLDEEGGNAGTGAPTLAVPAPESRAELLRLTKEKALLETQVERLGRERAALEMQLKTLLAQGDDRSRLQHEFAELHSQRELVAAAQATIDDKARQLADQRAELQRERNLLQAERRQLEAATPAVSRSEQELERERAELATRRHELVETEERLRADAARLQQERAELALERRGWHEDLALLRTEEQNLRDYENRLREMQAQLEADRVGWTSANSKPASRSPFTDDAALREAWAKLQRATEILEIERTHFREDKLALADLEKSVKHRESTLSVRELRLAEAERRHKEALGGMTPVAAPAAAPAPVAPPSKSATRGPFAMAKAVFGVK
ncbi:MAG: response regulator [Opitutae bacterium]|nr:response regulator [Opitutae bacterium]